MKELDLTASLFSSLALFIPWFIIVKSVSEISKVSEQLVVGDGNDLLDVYISVSEEAGLEVHGSKPGNEVANSLKQ